MSTTPEQVARSYVAPGTLWSLARNRDITTGAGKLIAQDLGVVTDRPAVSLQWDLVAGWPVPHGEVADEAAMLALHTYDSPAGDTPLLRYVAPGDSCIRTDDPGWRWHCLRGHGTQLSDWERRPLAGAIADLASGVAGAQPLDADLTAIAAQGVSAWGLTRLADSGATAAKNALGIQRADIGDASTAGRALMAVSTPSEASVPIISSTGSVSTTPLSSLGGGGGGWSVSATGPANAGQGGVISAANPSGASIAVVVTPSATGYLVKWVWTYTGPNVFWIIRIGSTAGANDIYQTSGTQTSNESGSFTITSLAVGYLQAIVQHTTGGSDLTIVNLTCSAGAALPTGAAGWMTDGAGHFVPYYE